MIEIKHVKISRYKEFVDVRKRIEELKSDKALLAKKLYESNLRVAELERKLNLISSIVGGK